MFDKTIHKNEFRLRILLTNQCNKSCNFCLNDFQPKQPAMYAKMFDITDCLRAYGTFMKSIKQTSIVTFSGGEPGIHANLDSILKVANYFCDIVKVVTNGTALRPELCDFVDCWHVGITDKKQSIIDFSKYSKDITVQIVVTENANDESFSELIKFYHDQGLKVKLFSDFYSERQSELANKITWLLSSYKKRISARFTGKQENRGQACAGCTNKCVTLKALWVFPNGLSSTCPQGVVKSFDDDSWDETMEKAYKLHYVQ